MNLHCKTRPILTLSLTIALLSACSFDANGRKQKYYQDGQIFFARGEYSAAAAEFAHAIKIDPGYADAHFQLGESYMVLRQPDHASEEFARVIELQPEDYRARLAAANLLISVRNFSQAKEQTDWLVKKRPNDPAVHSAISSLLAAQGNIPAAIDEMQLTITLAPNRWEPYLSLALLQAKSSQNDAAEASFKKVIEMDPKQSQPRVMLGAYYQSHDRLADAEREFREAIAVGPNNMAPREALAQFYLAEGKPSDAKQVLEQAQRDLPHNPDCLLALSNFYLAEGDADKAVAEYRSLYLDHPNDVLIKKKFIQLLIQTKRYDEAHQLDEEILKTNPSDNEALLYRSQMQISEGDVNSAEQTLQKIVTGAPNDSQAHYALGVALDKQGYPERAESEWREAVQLNPNLLEAQRAIADAAMVKGDMAGLEGASNQIVRLEPDSPEGYALRALSSINRNQFEQADRDVLRAIAVGPRNSFGYVQLGNLKFAEKQYSDAVKAYQDALDRNNSSTDALRGLMNAYLAAKQVDKAVAAAQAQISKSPNTGSFYDLLGSVLFYYKKDLSGADAAFTKAIALDANNSHAWLQLCEVRAGKGEVDQAIAMGEDSLKQNSRQPSLDILIGNLYEGRAEWKKADEAYQAALAVSPQNAVASNDLARVMLEEGENFDVALSLARTARRQLPNSPAVADTLGWIYYHQGMYERAVNSFTEALALQKKGQLPDNPDIHYHLGMTYEKAKQPALARENFEDVLRGHPNYRNVAEIRTELARLRSSAAATTAQP